MLIVANLMEKAKMQALWESRIGVDNLDLLCFSKKTIINSDLWKKKKEYHREKRTIWERTFLKTEAHGSVQNFKTLPFFI